MTQKYSNCPPNISDLIVRAELKKKDEALYEWPRKWGWMLKEYQYVLNNFLLVKFNVIGCQGFEEKVKYNYGKVCPYR